VAAGKLDDRSLSIKRHEIGSCHTVQVGTFSVRFKRRAARYP
jgi:hypothetical protein